MRVVMLCDSYSWGGLEINNFRLNQWINQLGHESILICPQGSHLHLQCQQADLPHTTYPASPSKQRYLYFALIHFLYRFLKQHQHTHLILGNSHEAHIGAILKLRGWKGKTAYLQQMKFQRLKKGFVHSLIYQQLDTWIAPLPYLKAQALAKTNTPASKFVIIPLCIDASPFVAASQDRPAARAAMQLEDGIKYVGIIGRLHPAKGHHILVKALKHLADDRVKMLAIGDRSDLDFPKEKAYKEELLKIAREEGIADRLVFKPFMPEPAQGFAALDCFVMASNEETYGMVTLEAMAAGTPVVGANCYGTAGLIQDGKNGYLFETDDPASLAQCIQQVFQSPEKRQKLQSYAQQYVLDGFQHHHWVKRLAEVLD